MNVTIREIREQLPEAEMVELKEGGRYLLVLNSLTTDQATAALMAFHLHRVLNIRVGLAAVVNPKDDIKVLEEANRELTLEMTFPEYLKLSCMLEKLADRYQHRSYELAAEVLKENTGPGGARYRTRDEMWREVIRRAEAANAAKA